jgi:glycosyltransferase involved in cell wall biosynthesis
VIQVGRIVANKGQLHTVEAAPAVLARHPGARFVFVGEPDRTDSGFAEQVRSRVRALGIEPAVSFVGRVPDAVLMIAGADVLVMPSLQLPGFYGWREGFGLVVAEAMAAGTPVVAYDDPALAETLAGCGALVPSGDSSALAQAISDVLADPERRKRMAEAGLVRAKDFSLDRAVEELSAVYARAFAGQSC